MGRPSLFLGLLINGVAYAAIFIAIAIVVRRFAGDVVWRVLLVVSLLAAAGLYVIFAARGSEGALWVVGEGLGFAIFGGMALIGFFRSVWWIVLGWALHPLWDVGLHYFGPGRSFAPETYTVACLSFDLLVAVYVTIVCVRTRPSSKETAG